MVHKCHQGFGMLALPPRAEDLAFGGSVWWNRKRKNAYINVYVSINTQRYAVRLMSEERNSRSKHYN